MTPPTVPPSPSRPAGPVDTPPSFPSAGGDALARSTPVTGTPDAGHGRGAAARLGAGLVPARRFGTAAAGFGRDLARHARRTPVTLVLVAVLWVLAGVTGSLPNGPDGDTEAMVGAGVPSLSEQRWWTLATSGLFAADLITYVVVTVLLLIVGIVFEHRWGSLRMVAFTLLVQVVGTAVGIGAVALSSLLNWVWPQYLAELTAVGPTPLIAGLLTAYSAGLSAQWRRRIRVGVLTVCLVLVLYGGQLQDVLRSGAALVGLLAGRCCCTPVSGRGRSGSVAGRPACWSR